ncbi:Disease resistance protein rpp13 protein [Thalictrum thalictroides]|uniref:Disease resistance protein rpp13 protein n=1 Tax=Thalictrum thalictroides TaxID=46969 RepID=A0A7J6WN86_THATH|nr:Disease resistance protein rpp13 protein [Thalictrum thalictroides]
MSEAIVKFSIQRLKSLVLQESLILSGLEDQTQSFITILDEIGGLYSIDPGTQEHYKFESRWFCRLKNIIQNMEDCIDEFVIQMKNQSGSDHQTSLINLCRNELEKLKESLVELMNRMYEHKKEKEVKVDYPDTKESSSSQADEAETDEIHTPTSPTPIKYYHISIPFYLRSCLMYCAIFPEKYGIAKGRLIRLLVAEGLIQEKPGEIPEDIADEYIKTLVGFGVLVADGSSTTLKVNEGLQEFLHGMMEQEDFIASCTSSDTNISPTTRRLSIHSDAKNIPTNLSSLPIQSLFLFGIGGSLSDTEFDCLRPVFHGKKFLRVLDLERVNIKTLPDEVGDLIHLRYLNLWNANLNELPESIFNLLNLQSLDVRFNNLKALSSGVLKLTKLRHLQMLKHSGVAGVRLPAGIGSLKDLQTLTGIYAGGGIALELGQLTQLRELGIMDLTEDDVNDVCVSVMKMEGLISLALEAKSSYPEKALPSIEPFSPPPLLQKLRLEGTLPKLPDWFPLMENLNELRLGFTHLAEDPALVLQFLPNLKHLTLWHAHDAKTIGKEFCRVGGFLKLEVLVIASRVLEEWTELEEGAFPSLKYLHVRNCLKLRMLPEGLQHLTTLQELKLLPLHDDLEVRLKPDGGEENYKIKNIPSISYMTNSMVQQIARGHAVEGGTERV